MTTLHGWCAQAFADKLVEVVSMDEDFVWLHDYHLLVLPSLLRKRFNRIRLGLFLHSPFPSSEIFRTFPRREEILRSLLNADLLGTALHLQVALQHLGGTGSFARCMKICRAQACALECAPFDVVSTSSVTPSCSVEGCCPP